MIVAMNHFSSVQFGGARSREAKRNKIGYTFCDRGVFDEIGHHLLDCKLLLLQIHLHFHHLGLFLDRLCVHVRWCVRMHVRVCVGGAEERMQT